MLLRRKIESEGYTIALFMLMIRDALEKYVIQGERSEKHVDRKFKDVRVIAVFDDTHDRIGSQVNQEYSFDRKQKVQRRHSGK